MLWEQGVIGSNPISPTIHNSGIGKLGPSRQPHKLKIVSSNLTPATTLGRYNMNISGGSLLFMGLLPRTLLYLPIYITNMRNILLAILVALMLTTVRANEQFISAQDLFKNGYVESAIEELNQFLLEPPNKYTKKAQLLLARCYLLVGKNQRAQAEMRAFANEYPEDKNLVAQYLVEEVPKTYSEKKLVKEGESFTYDVSTSSYLQSNKYGTELYNSISSNSNWKKDEYILKSKYRYSNIIDHQGIKRASSSQALVSLEDTTEKRSIIIGRQNPLHGMTKRFDGVSGSYEYNKNYTLYFGIGSGETALGISTQLGSWDEEATINSQGILGFQSRYFLSGVSNTTFVEYSFNEKLFKTLLTQGYIEYSKFKVYYLLDKRSLYNYSSSLAMVGSSTDIGRANFYVDIQYLTFKLGEVTNESSILNARLLYPEIVFALSFGSRDKSLIITKTITLGKFRFESMYSFRKSLNKTTRYAALRVNYSLSQDTSIESQLAFDELNSFYIGIRHNF